MLTLPALVGTDSCHKILWIHPAQVGRSGGLAHTSITMTTTASNSSGFTSAQCVGFGGRSFGRGFGRKNQRFGGVLAGIVGRHLHDGIIIHILDSIGHCFVAAPSRLVYLEL